MISREKAQALKEAGLRWEPKAFDLYVINPDKPYREIICLHRVHVESANKWAADDPRVIWLPRLDQMLEEIEKCFKCTGRWSAGKRYDGGYYVCLHPFESFYADELKDVAADALLWLLNHKET